MCPIIEAVDRTPDGGRFEARASVVGEYVSVIGKLIFRTYILRDIADIPRIP